MRKVIGWVIVIAIVIVTGYIVIKTKEENREYNKNLMINEGK